MALYLSLVVMFLLIGGTTAQCQLQLVGGFGASSGYLQVFVGEWRYASLSSQASSDGGDALCQQLGFEGASNMSMVPVGDVSTEPLDIAQCNSTQGLLVGMGCEVSGSNETQDVLYMDCIQADNANGTVRLMSNTTGTTEGVLQTSVNGRWLLVDTIMPPSVSDASAICRLLGAGDAVSVTTEVVISVGTVLVPEVGCTNGTTGSSSTLDCITNGSVIRPGANLTDGSMGMVSNATFCTVSVASAVYISCANRNGEGPTVTRVRTGFPLTFTLIITVTSVAIAAVAVVAIVMYLCLCLFCCKRKSSSSIWKRARSLRSRATSYSFVWRQAAPAGDINGTPAETNTTEYAQWQDEDSESIKSGSMRIHTDSGSYTATTFGRQQQVVTTDWQQNAA